ncbi:hypothetical protein MPTK1_8g07440 [Marchantia polymorpha subsp. ruderalis]|uniref:Uncharacterized protein n=1 Tax=Marchantia polymorpha TaxID=3197 RepID=A0A2R6XI91_MARPO|nr:hypothetical protein MARPO_0013s0049 [Marchantia polymorpha]BBN19029.1 hypothetical protein Mp_8g07440 [Marchantia polymorpha subsp. ruderalis]|eukprot:PTQ45817.1 hypothetical protein MARPO_0013s0049 [Marchantia polymorpha]
MATQDGDGRNGAQSHQNTKDSTASARQRSHSNDDLHYSTSFDGCRAEGPARLNLVSCTSEVSTWQKQEATCQESEARATSVEGSSAFTFAAWLDVKLHAFCGFSFCVCKRAVESGCPNGRSLHTGGSEGGRGKGAPLPP